MKKNYVIVLGLMLVIVLSYFFVFRKDKTPKPNPSPSASQVKVENVLQDEKIFFPTLDSKTGDLYYFGDKGAKLKKFNTTSQKKEILFNQDILFTISTFWSPDFSKVVIKNNDPNASSSNKLLDIKTKTLTDINTDIQNVLWSADSQKIYYHFLDSSDQNFVALASPDGSGWEKLFEAQYLSYGLIWLDNFQNIGYWSVPTDAGGTRLKSFNLASKETKDIIPEYKLGNAISSPDGSLIIYENVSSLEEKHTIGYLNSNGSNNKNTDLESFIDKTTLLSDSQIIISVKEDDDLTESFYVVNTKDGSKVKLQYKHEGPDPLIDIKNLMTVTEKTIYFTADDILYKLNLP